MGVPHLLFLCEQYLTFYSFIVVYSIATILGCIASGLFLKALALWYLIDRIYSLSLPSAKMASSKDPNRTGPPHNTTIIRWQWHPTAATRFPKNMAWAPGFFDRRLASSSREPRRSFADRLSARDKVFDIVELRELILSFLEPIPLRNAMSVCKVFYNTINAPNSARCRYALALDYGPKRSQRVLTKDENEKLLLLSLHSASGEDQISWLLNFKLGPIIMRPSYQTLPVLELMPFKIISMRRNVKTGPVVLQLWLDADNARARERRVPSRLDRDFSVHNFHTSDSWKDIRLCKFPLPIKVSITVDFRVPMNARNHVPYACQYHLCQVGRYGFQSTTCDFKPGSPNANLGMFTKFLQYVEDQIATINESMAATNRRNARPDGQSFWMGPTTTIPPLITPRWRIMKHPGDGPEHDL